MEILYLGTGAAEGVPAMFCNCETCQEVRKRGVKEFHSRSQVIVDGSVGIDFPPDAYYHALLYGVDLSAVEYLLVTHSHMDHFYAHDFILRGYKYAKTLKKSLTIYGNAEVCAVFQECTRRELRPEIAETICVKEVQPFQLFSFGEYTATALKAQHSKAETAYVYLLEKGGNRYLHLTDTGRLPAETLDFLKNHFRGKHTPVDLVTFDCTFLFWTAGEVSRHMGLGDNAVMREELLRRSVVDERTKYVITHFSHNSAPLKENLERAELEFSLQAAYDGMKVEI